MWRVELPDWTSASAVRPGLDGAGALSARHGASVSDMPPAIYLGQILCPEGVIAKVNGKHDLTERDIRDAVQWPARPIKAVWIGLDDDPRGPRAVVTGRVADGRVIQVVLYPVGDPAEGTWRLGTAVVET